MACKQSVSVLAKASGWAKASAAAVAGGLWALATGLVLAKASVAPEAGSVVGRGRRTDG